MFQTDAGPLVVPQGSLLKPKSQWWCSGCARNGHLEHECNYYNRMYPPTTPIVFNYEDVFNSRDYNNIEPEIKVQKDLTKTNDLSRIKKIPSLLEIILPNPVTNSVSSNTENVHSLNEENTISTTVVEYLKYNVNASSSSSKRSTVKQGTNDLQHNDGLLQSDYGALIEETNTNKQAIICLQHDKGVPLPNYNCVTENTNHSSQDVKIPELEVIDKKHLTDYRTVTKDSTTNNLNISILNSVPKVSSVITPSDEHKLDEAIRNKLLTMGPLTADNLCSVDLSNTLNKSKHIIMSMPCVDVKKFLRRELFYIQNKISQYNPRLLRDKFYKYDRHTKNWPTRNIRAKCFWFRALNMFIFGVHKYRDGSLHINYLKEYLTGTSSALSESKRKALLGSYHYIFGFDKHINVNYPKILKVLIQRYDQGKINKPLL